MNLRELGTDPRFSENSHLNNGIGLSTILSRDDISPSFEEDLCCPCPWGYGSLNKCRPANILEKVQAGEIPTPPCLRT